jgi:DNA repair exonuclease SbcCD ATPase subunit
METANTITINTDDKNLAKIIKKIIADAELTVDDLFDDDEIVEYIREAEMPVDEVYDEDDILDCGCVRDAIAQEREDCEQETVEKYEEEIEEYEEQVGQLEKTIAELKKKIDEVKEDEEMLRLAHTDQAWCAGRKKEKEEAEKTIAKLKEAEEMTIAQYEETIADLRSCGAKPVMEYNRQLGEQNAELKKENAELKEKRAEFEREKTKEIMGDILALCSDKLDRLTKENAELKKKMEEWSAKMGATHGDLTKSAEDAVAEYKKKNDKLKLLYRAKCAEADAIIHETLGRFGKCCDGHGVGGWFEIVDPPMEGGQNLRHIIPKE